MSLCSAFRLWQLPLRLRLARGNPLPGRALPCGCRCGCCCLLLLLLARQAGCCRQLLRCRPLAAVAAAAQGACPTGCVLPLGSDE